VRKTPDSISVAPKRPVVAICGDFALALGVMELETVVRHGVPIVVIMADNDGNVGSLR
jgi:thiamine pyrophosphate-dependent acetolactate synthase large subunit-like protein